jgi:UDP-2,3-diacylglucosamine hydrolase
VRLTRTLFISDLHLDEARPEATARFERFLHEAVPGAGALYILGDLFEYWVGDDSLSLPLPSRAASLLKDAAAALPTRFMHGNRDFLVARKLSDATGVGLIEDPTIVELHGTRTLLMHGDTLCTDDHAYQAFRSKVRDPAWQAAALAQPLGARVAIARQMRLESEGAKEGKAAAIMDVSPAAVERAFAETGCTLMIHGHTHRPGRHVYRVDGRECVRWVLPDWYEGGGYLEVSPEGVRATAVA